jgi:hypothetical protein
VRGRGGAGEARPCTHQARLGKVTLQTKRHPTGPGWQDRASGQMHLIEQWYTCSGVISQKYIDIDIDIYIHIHICILICILICVQISMQCDGDIARHFVPLVHSLIVHVMQSWSISLTRAQSLSSCAEISNCAWPVLLSVSDREYPVRRGAEWMDEPTSQRSQQYDEQTLAV